MNLIRYLYQRSARMMLWTTSASFVAGVSSAALVAVIGKAIADVGNAGSYAMAFVGLCLVYVLSKSSAELGLLRLTQGLVQHLRTTLGARVLATPQKQLQAIGSDGLHVILTRDIDTFTQAFQVMPAAFSSVVLIVAAMAYTAWQSWQVCLGLLGGLLISVGGYLLAERQPARKLAELREQTGGLYRELRELVMGSRELQLNDERAAHFLGRVIGVRTQRCRDLFVQSMSRYTWILNVGNIMFYQGIGFLLFVLPLWSPQSSETIVASALIVLYLIRPVSELIVVMPTIRNAAVALRKIEQLEARLGPALVQPTTQAAAFPARAACLLELDGVAHSYQEQDGDRFQLGPINLRIHEHEILFIIGGNGSGKTTLAMLLLGLAAPTSGTLSFRGTPVDDANRQQYRQHFAAIFSDFHLFEHVLGADQPLLLERANAYLAKFGLGEKVGIDGDKFSTIKLSTGQRKRLALVAAYLEDRPVYLFDEWAADQDPLFKRVFYAEILPDLKRRGKTVIIVSHDDQYFSYADRIVKLDSGALRVLPVAGAAA